MRPTQSGGHDGALRCECRASPEPGTICSDVEPQCLRYFRIFCQQQRSPVGTVNLYFFAFIESSHQSSLTVRMLVQQRLADFLLPCGFFFLDVSWERTQCSSVHPAEPPFPDKRISKQTKRSSVYLLFTCCWQPLSQDVGYSL